MEQQKRISRRQFVKRAMAASGGLAAGGALAAFNPAAAANLPPPEQWDQEADVVVVGGGIAGLGAALVAAQEGRKVIMLEASKKAGGTMLFSSGMMGFAKGSKYEEMMQRAPESDPVLAKRMMDTWEEHNAWLEKSGIPIMALPPFKFGTWELEGYVRFGGEAIPNGPRIYVEAMVSAIEKAGATILLETKGIGLFSDDDGAVVGVKAMGKDGAFSVGTRAVVLAAGGFQANKEMLVRYVGPDADLTLARCVPYNDGGSILMGLAAGGTMSRSCSGFYGHMVPYPFVVPQDPEAFEAAEAAQLQEILGNLQNIAPHSLVFNLAGERFVDESLGDDIINQHTARQAKARAFIVFDHAIRDGFAGESAITKTENIQLLIDSGAIVEQADTLEELADKLKSMGMHRANFLRNVTAFNQAVAEKTSADLPIAKAEGLAHPLETGPFYAVPATSGISQLFGGLAISTEAEVLGVGHVPVRGLYAAPGTAGGIMHGDAWCMLSGNAVFGYIAGKSAAAFAEQD